MPYNLHQNYSHDYGIMEEPSITGIYLTPEFETERKKFRTSNGKVAKAIFPGLPGDPLGKFTVKKRLALPGVGAREGAGSIIFFNHGVNIFFFDIYLKSELSKKKGKELEDDEIDAYCNIAKDFISMRAAMINKLLSDKELIEVKGDDCTTETHSGYGSTL